MAEKKGILMICLGNICRSPIAEAVMFDIVKKHNLSQKFRIDSAAIGKNMHVIAKSEKLQIKN